MTITPRLFEAFLKCPTKCWLRFAGEPPAANAYAEWVQTENESYRANAARRLIAGAPEADCAIAPAATNLKAAQWRFAVDIELRSSRGNEAQTSSPVNSQSLLTSAATVQSHLHAVERIPSEGRGRAAQFVPIRFISRNKLTKDDKLLLAFDALVLSELLGRDVSLGKIIHGDLRDCVRSSRGNEAHTSPAEINQSLLTSAATQNETDEPQTGIPATRGQAQPRVTKVKTSALAGEVRKCIEKLAALLADPAPPDLVLNRHCAECEFQARCRKIAVEKDDLSLLAGMSAKERQKLRSKGIFTVTQLSYTFRPRRRPKRQRDKREKYHHALKALAIREKKIHIVGSPELKIEGTPVYLDVEGLPDRDFYYLIGVRIGNGDSAVQHSLWADAIEDEGKIWREFLTILEAVEKPVLIHYGSYETTFLKAMKELHGSPQDESVAAKSIGAAINLVSALFARTYFPTFSNGLKEIAGFFGCKWSEIEASGIKSIVWRLAWERERDPAIKEKLLVYNAEDVTNLQELSRVCTQIKSASGKRTGEHSCDAVQADTLKRLQRFRWGEGEYSLQAFRSINLAAYWDYQRERVYLRKTLRQIPSMARRTFRPRTWDQAIDIVSPPDFCEGCGHAKFYKSGYRQKIVHDLQFRRRGVFRRVTRFRSFHFACARCNRIVTALDDSLPRDKYGPGLLAYLVYHLVEIYVPQEGITKMLNALFDLRIRGSGQINPIKARAAEFYRPTYGQILGRIRHGQLLHVDETKANVQGRQTYAWVFTSLAEVVYVYSESREAELPRELLSDFKGVLVSDFYSAYDAMNCRQQKCLVHLLRDINTELLNAPFDGELHCLAERIGSLLTGILATIDRFGLKSRYLRKHKAEAVGFLMETASARFESKAALKLQKRISRYRDALFTFLDCDGVSWNNNNAEHAVKAFARLRSVIRGASTERGIRDYLVLLSICQTCKYMGLDFLDFLRSGENDIYAFAERRRGRKGRAQTKQPTDLPADAIPDGGGQL